MKIQQSLFIALLVALIVAPQAKANPVQPPHTILMPEDPCDSGDGKKCENNYTHGVSLEVIGLDGSGSINEKKAKSIRFVLHGIKVDFSLTTIDLTIEGNKHQSAFSWFDYDNTSQSFTLSSKGLKDLVSAVKKSDTASLAIDLSTKNYEETYLFVQPFHYQDR